MTTIPAHTSYESLVLLSALPQEIPIVEGPLRGPEPAGDSTLYGGISIDNKHADDYQRARDYLSYGQYTLTPQETQSTTSKSIDLGIGDPVMRSAFMRLEDSFDSDAYSPKTTIMVNHDHIAQIKFLPSGSFHLHWSPRSAEMTPDGKGITPALCLGHEVIHASHYLESPDMFMIRSLTPEDRYTNREEKLALIRENATARILGEGMRTAHGTGTFSLNKYSNKPLSYCVSHPMDSQVHTDEHHLIKAAYDAARIYSSANFLDQEKVNMAVRLANSGDGWQKYINKQFEHADSLYYKGVIRSVKHAFLARLRNNIFKSVRAVS